MEKIDYIHGPFTIVDTDPSQFEYESYEEHCDINGIEPCGKDSDEYFEWCAEEAEEAYNCDMDEVRACKEYNVPCVITGTLGLWDGKHNIHPTKVGSVYDAIIRCYGRDSLSNLKVNYEDGKIVVYYSHHDGTNIFFIHALSENSRDKDEETITESDFARLPYIYAIGIE